MLNPVLKSKEFFPLFRGNRIFGNHSLYYSNSSKLQDKERKIIYYDFPNPYPEDLENYISLSKNLKNYLQYNIFLKIFNIAVANQADPFLILDSNFKPINFTLDHSEIKVGSKVLNKNPCYKNINRVFGLKNINSIEEPIDPEDIIFGIVYPGLHLINIDYIWDIIKSDPLGFDKIIGTYTILSYLFRPTISLANNKIHNLFSENIVKKIIIPNANIEQSLEPHIPDGLRAIIDTKLWGLDSSFKSLLEKLNIPEHYGYKKFSGSVGAFLVVKAENRFDVTSLLANDFPYPLILIGGIEAGNIGPKVELKW